MAFDNLLTRLIAQIAKSEATKDLLAQYGPPSQNDVLHDGLVGAGETWGGILGGAAGTIGGETVGGPRGAALGGLALGSTGALAGGWAAHGAYREGQLIRDILSRPENWTVDAAGAIVPITQEPPLPLNSNGSIGAGVQSKLQGSEIADPSPLPSGDWWRGLASPASSNSAPAPVRGGSSRIPSVMSVDPNQLPQAVVAPIGTADDTPSLPAVRFPPEALLAPDRSRALHEWASSTPRGTGVAPTASVFDKGTAPIPYAPAPPQNAPGGLPGLIASVAGIDPSNPDQPRAGGLLALLQEYMRNNPDGDSAR